MSGSKLLDPIVWLYLAILQLYNQSLQIRLLLKRPKSGSTGPLSISGNQIITRFSVASRPSRISCRLQMVCVLPPPFCLDISDFSSFFFQGGQSAEAQMLIASLRDVIRQQSEEVDALKNRLKESINVEVTHICYLAFKRC